MNAESLRLSNLTRCLFIQRRRSSGTRTLCQQSTTQARVCIFHYLILLNFHHQISQMTLITIHLPITYNCKSCIAYNLAIFLFLCIDIFRLLFTQLVCVSSCFLSSQAVLRCPSWISSFWPSTTTCWGTLTSFVWSPPMRSDRTSRMWCGAWSHGEMSQSP